MENGNIITEKEFNESSLNQKVESTNELKEWLVDYCGKVQNPDKEEVTVETIVEVLADQFPEFLMAVAEENWIRGYHQALADVEEGENMMKNQPIETPDKEHAEEYHKWRKGQAEYERKNRE